MRIKEEEIRRECTGSKEGWRRTEIEIELYEKQEGHLFREKF